MCTCDVREGPAHQLRGDCTEIILQQAYISFSVIRKSTFQFSISLVDNKNILHILKQLSVDGHRVIDDVYGANTPNCILHSALPQNTEQNHRLCKVVRRLSSMGHRCSALAANELIF